MSSPEIWILDTETTGLRGKPVEVGGVQIDWSGRKLMEFEQRINPCIDIEPGATAIHGIRDEDVIHCPTLQAFFGKQSVEILWIGHNAHFDVRACEPVLTPSQVLCTLALSRKHIGKATPNHKLTTLVETFNFSAQKAHSALGDCRNTHELLLHIMEITGLSLATLFERAKEPQMIHKMPFGRHQGSLMTSVPNRYRQYLLENGDLSRDLRYTLEKLKHL